MQSNVIGLLSKGQLGDSVRLKFSQEPIMYAPVTWASCIRTSEILKLSYSILAKENDPFIYELSPTPHLTTSHQVENKASTLCCRPALSADAVDRPPSSSSIQLFLCCFPFSCPESTPPTSLQFYSHCLILSSKCVR